MMPLLYERRFPLSPVIRANALLPGFHEMSFNPMELGRPVLNTVKEPPVYLTKESL
jgi:hypothetical protein